MVLTPFILSLLLPFVFASFFVLIHFFLYTLQMNYAYFSKDGRLRFTFLFLTLPPLCFGLCGHFTLCFTAWKISGLFTFLILTIPLPLVLAHVITLQFTLYLCEVDRFTSPLLTILLPFAHAVILQYTLYLSLLLVG